jgi:DNA-binding SARP family transcriptional activator
MSPVLAEVVAQRLDPAETEGLRDRVAGSLEPAGRLAEALDCRLGGDGAATLALLERRGHELVAQGYGARVAAVLTSPPMTRTAALDGILGEALQSTGDWDGAIDRFARVRQTIADGRLPAATAWRYGALLYLRGESDEAEAVLDTANLDGAASADRALVSAWLSSTLWSRGDTERSAGAATVALGLGAEDDVPAALAAAHVAAALVAASAGDRRSNERHYRAALTAAQHAGDSVQLTRIRANLSSRALEESDYRLAIVEADRALSVGSGHRFFVALAMCNRAEALLCLGEVDEARATLLEVIETYSALGSLVVCAPQCLLGVIDRERGDLARARVSFERAVQLAEQADDAHTLVFALAGLAKTLCQDDPEAASALVGRAIAMASSLERAPALCAAATVHLWAGDPGAAGRVAADAEAEARRTADRASLAEALALRGIAERPASVALLEAAVELWEEVGNPIGRQRAALALAVCRGNHEAVVGLREELAGRGVTPDLGPPQDGTSLERPTSGAELVITTLGRFTVQRHGARLPTNAWQSRKARDLLKLLVGRRGRSIAREAAAEALWPGEPPGPLANRLSVALSTLRKVLDPERAHPADHFVASDGQTLALRLVNVNVDVVGFLEAASGAVALASDGGPAGAETELRAAEALYTGDFLEEDLYEDWAVDCREAARAASLEISRLLARGATERDDDETASRHLRRLLERDPYDEDAWIALVGAQSRLRRYGEARRQHAIYVRRMGELGSEPVALAQTVDARP